MRNDRFSVSRFSGVIAAAILSSGYAPAAASEPVAARYIRAGEIIAAGDIETPQTVDALRRAAKLVGLEASRAIYKGQPLTGDALRKPTLVERNAIVAMEFVKGPLAIAAEGRALEQGGEGQRIRVMNLSSRRVVTAIVVGPNAVRTLQ